RSTSQSPASIGHIAPSSRVKSSDRSNPLDVTGRHLMEARMINPALVVPDAMQALQALGKAARKGGVPPKTIELVNLRASQINGCSVCVDMHARDLKRAGETDERVFAVAAWRETPYFSDAERAALALS